MKLLSLLTLLSCLVSFGELQQPYRVLLQARNINNITLFCQNGGFTVDDAVFYRNGVLQSEDTDCLHEIASAPINGRMDVALTASCEGYYQCGVQITANTFILSGPTILNAYPVVLPGRDGTIETEVTMGTDATLLCPVEVSLLNSFSVTWQRLVNGVLSSVDYPLNDDYSVVIPNVTFEYQGVYFCTVTSIPFSSVLAARVNGPTNILSVTAMHVPPVFSVDLTVRRNNEEEYVFSVQAKGTDPLSFKWLLDDMLIESEEIEVVPLNSNQVVEKLSRIEISFEEFNDAEEETMNLTVIVANMEEDQLFYESQTSFILRIQQDDDDERTSEPQPTDNDCTASAEESKDIDREQILRIAVYTLGSILMVSWIFISILMALVVYYRQKFKGTCSKCAERKNHGREGKEEDQIDHQLEQLGPRTQRTHDHRTRQPHDDVEIIMHYERSPEPKPDSAFSCIRHCPPHPQEAIEYRNPVSFILYRVANMYYDAKPSDCTLMRLLHQVLLEVLNDENVASSPEAMAYVKKLRDGVREFGDKLREEHKCYRRQYSRQQTVGMSSKPSSKGSLGRGSGSYELLQEEEMPEEIFDATEEVDGDDNVPEGFSHMTNIEQLLTEWIERRIEKFARDPPPAYYAEEGETIN